MSIARLLPACLALAIASPASAQKCPSVQLSILDKGFPQAAPWRVTSGGPGQCSFSARNTSVNFGFSHAVARSTEAATAAAVEMRQAVAGTSLVEPMLTLGEHGIAYQMKAANGQVDGRSMFFYGHRGTIGVSGYLNLGQPITPAQRDLAAGLLSMSLGAVSAPKTLAKASNCRYLDPALVARLLPSDDLTTIVPDANNCVLSAGGKVITVSVGKDARGWAAAERLLKDGGCAVEPVANAGKAAGIAHHCSKGNPRAEVVIVTGSRVLKVLFAPPAEPTADERAALVELARAAAKI